MINLIISIKCKYILDIIELFVKITQIIVYFIYCTIYE